MSMHESMLKFDPRTFKGLLKSSKALKMKIFIFELESKLERHFDVKFDGECDDEGLES